jgi:predicted NACHT family NTPase
MPIDSLVKEMREKIKPSIQERCSTMRVLDMSKPMELNKIYTPVYISEKISAKRCLDIEQLTKDYEKYDNFAFLSTETFPGIEVVNRYSKLIIFGKAGGGKTTFLKYLALQCVENNFYSHLVPIFISLREFAEASNKPGLLEYMVKIIEKSYYPREDKTNVTELLLSQGRFFILLDSLDEIPIDDNISVIKEIQLFSEYFPRNKFIITSRFAAQEYLFKKFTEVELADFDNEQISNFVDNWFKNASGESKSFIKSLESDAQIKEFARTPLLLVLLCLKFQEIRCFKKNNYGFYQEVANIFFRKWDLQRGIQRQTIYSKLTKEQKEYLLGFIAIGVLELGKYLFTKKFVKEQINFCISNLPSYSDKVDIPQINSEAIFKSILVEDGLIVERGQGIYSFSHIALYEYFSAEV